MKKPKVRGIFSGEKGQRIFNILYSIGASIVILGALFKILHTAGADLMLIIGMGTEAVIFFLSAFDEKQMGSGESIAESLERIEKGERSCTIPVTPSHLHTFTPHRSDLCHRRVCATDDRTQRHVGKAAAVAGTEHPGTQRHVRTAVA